MAEDGKVNTLYYVCQVFPSCLEISVKNDVNLILKTKQSYRKVLGNDIFVGGAVNISLKCKGMLH